MKARAVEARLLTVAPWLLAVSVMIHFVMVATQAKMTMIDLMVYRGAPPSILHGTLYEWRLAQYSQQFALPFTYPPFAAVLFLPLSLLPWLVVRWVWQIVSVACLWWLVRVSLRLIVRDHIARSPAAEIDEDVWRRRAMFWTAIALWAEPVRTTLNYGQINLILAAVVLAGMASSKSALSGISVGIAAGVKLTPALSTLYFLVTKRWVAAAWSFLAFGLTVGIAYAVSATQSNQYWFHLLGETNRIGPVASAINQSLRAALSRTVGYDVGSGPLWLAGVLVAALLVALALHSAVRAGDMLAGIVAVQFFTLLVSPISWSHHWVWIVPALLWTLYGRCAGERLVVVNAIALILAAGSFLVTFLLMAQPSIWVIPRPWYLAMLGWVYPVCGLLTLATIGLALRERRPSRRAQPVLAAA